MDKESPLIMPGRPSWPEDGWNARPVQSTNRFQDLDQGERPVRFGRAAFLGLLGVGAGSLLVGSQIGPVFSAVNSITASILPTDGFRIYTVAAIPQLKASTFTLTVDGLVAHPQTVSLSDVLAMPSIHIARTYQCVTGWVVPHVHWQGVPLTYLMNLVRPTSSARFVSFYCADGAYTESLTLAEANRSDVMLGYKLNEKPLSVDQGYPLRLVVPGNYGYKFAKWVNRVTFSDTQLVGYWERGGYDINATDPDLQNEKTKFLS